MTPELVQQMAFDAHAAGLCVVPPAEDGTKRPGVGKWKQFQARRPTDAELGRWYPGRVGVGWVCGQVSGGLEVLDFDSKEVYREFRAVALEVGLGELVRRIERGYLEESPRGVHWPYFCDTVEGNLKLAQGPHRESLIETRGEGGYIVTAPSHGQVNTAGPYELKAGSVQTIARLSPEERAELHALARTFDQVEAPEAQPSTFSDGLLDGRPGDDFVARTSWAEVLEPHGWVLVRSGEVNYWRRPGKKVGVSATTNYAGSDLLYVFTTSTAFEPERGYNRFSAYALLEHGGDFAAAARELRLKGYGGPAVTPGVDLSGLAAPAPAPPPSPAGFPPHLLEVPGLVGELADFINRTSVKPQPILALAASIAAVGTIAGRKVRTETGLRTNIYVLGVAETGAGKERARQAVRQVFTEAGAGPRAAFDDIASDAAIITALDASPSALFMFDEVGRMLKAMAADRAPTHVANQVGVYLRLYGAAGGTFYGKAYADADKQLTIEQPCLSIYGTTVPSRLYESITTDQVLDGFLSRLLVFESEDPDPEYRHVEECPPPVSLVEGFRAWEQAPENSDEGAGNLERMAIPAPQVIPETAGARAVFDDLEADMRGRRATVRARGDEPGIYTRVGTGARKLALIRACGRSIYPTIEREDAEWGAELAVYLVESMVRRIAESASDNATEAATKRLSDIIRSGGPEGLTLTQVTRKTQWLRRNERLELLATVQEAGIVRRIDVPGRTKTTIRYIHADHPPDPGDERDS